MLAARPALTITGMVRRNLTRHPLRTSLTVLGVAVGVLAIVALASLVAGFRATIQDGIKLGGAGMVIYQAGVAADILSSLDEAQTRAKLLADPAVAQVTAGLGHVMPVEQQRFTVVIGVESEGFTYNTQYVDGPPVSAADECSLGAIAARNLKKRIGDKLQLGDRLFRVVSTFESGVPLFDAGLTLRLDVLQKMLSREGRASVFFVKLRDGADVRATARRLEAANPEIVAVTNASEYRKVDLGLEIAEGMVWSVSLAAIVIGSVIVLNTMWMTVLERTREIGVLRAVGWSRAQVMRAVLLESALIGVVALVLGIGLGMGLAYLITLAPFIGQFSRPVFEPRQMAVAAVAAILLSLIGGWLPAWRAARISPAEALRYE